VRNCNPQVYFNVTVEYNDQRYVLNLYVVRCQGQALFGREWLKHIKLDWSTLNFVQTTTVSLDTATKLKLLQERYSDIFQPGLGKLTNIQAKLVLKDGAQPKFVKAWQVPYALKPKVEAELDALERDGVLTKVDFSEWATAIVPVGGQAQRCCAHLR